jgi:hypothetical protein
MKECNSIQEFNEEFFKGKNITWFNNIGLLKLNNIMVAEFNLLFTCEDPKLYDGVYIGYTVTIKDYNETIVSNNFYFDECINIPQEIDGWKIVPECQYGFFIMDPEDKEIENMVDKIFEFINSHELSL